MIPPTCDCAPAISANVAPMTAIAPSIGTRRRIVTPPFRSQLGRRAAGSRPRRWARTMSAPGGGSPTWRTRPSPVTQARSAVGSRSAGESTPGRWRRRRARVACRRSGPTTEQHDDALAERGDVVGLVRRQQHGRPFGLRARAAPGSAAAARGRARPSVRRARGVRATRAAPGRSPPAGACRRRAGGSAGA